MRNRTWLLAILSCIAAVVCGAATAAAAPPAEAAAAVSLDVLFGRPACFLGAKQAGINPGEYSCSAQAICYDGSVISCSDSGTGTCVGVDTDCSVGQQGYVSCGSSTTYCEASCPLTCDVEACSVGCSVNSDCAVVCCGHGFCTNGGCSPKPYIKFCICA